MKVLSITPYPPKTDGIAVHTKQLLSALSERGDVDVAVMTTRRPEVAELEPQIHRVLSGDPRCVFTAYRTLVATSPDVVHVQYALPAQGLAVVYAVVAAVWYRRRYATRIVVTMHEVRRELDVLRTAGAWIFRVLAKCADQIVVHTEESRSLLTQRCHADPAKIVVTPLGVAPSVSSTPETLVDVQGRYSEVGKEIVVFFGWIHPDKGIEDLIDAVALLAATASGVEKLDLLICGAVRPRAGVFRYFGKKDFEYERQLRDAVVEHRLETVVHFQGFVPDADVAALLALAQVVVLPYRNTTQSAVLGHAIAAGVPVVASDLPGLAETLRDGGGVLVAPRDPQALCRALDEVLHDADYAAGLRSRQRSLLQQMTFAKVAEQLVHDCYSRRPSTTFATRP